MTVERDHDGAELREIGDDVGDPRPWPWPLAEICQALFVDIDDSDRAGRLHAGIEALVEVEDPDPKLFDRRKIGNTQGHYSDQQREADQPRIAEPAPEPALQYPEPLHAGCINQVRQ